jgi:hypothetical protein
MIRRKTKKEDLQQDVVAANRMGCGCIAVFLFGIVAAMIIAGYMQLQG